MQGMFLKVTKHFPALSLNIASYTKPASDLSILQVAYS